jgi:hypothetical protein
MTRFCSKKNYEQTGTKAFIFSATEIHSHHCLYCDTIFPQFDDLIKHSRENHPHRCYYCKTTFVSDDFSVIFIHQSFLQYISFHSMWAIQRETERNSGLRSSWSSFCGTLSLIFDISKHGAKEMGHVKMAGALVILWWYACISN